MHAAATVLAILFGWLFTVAVSWALGTLLLRWISLTCSRAEERLLAFVVGSAGLSAIVFALCAARVAWKAVYLTIGLAILACALLRGAHRPKGNPFPPLPRLWFWVFVAAFGTFTCFYFTNALMPETSADGMAYHLGVIAKYQRAHGFFPITTNFYASLSEGIELLFLFAFAFGRHSAAALVHYSFLLCLTFLILSYGRRIGRPGAGVAAAIFVYASPIVGQDGSVAYNDVALAAVLFALFYLLQIWDLDKNPRVLIPIGILAGFGYAIKYTALLAMPYALGFVVWKLWKSGKPVIRPALAVSVLALAFILPWMVKNWIEVANPVSPFYNRVFLNPYVHISFEDYYRQYLRRYALTSYWQIPWQVTVRGDLTTGFFGPLFLLTPLALLALRLREGRQLLLAGLVFGLTYWTNVGTRFLIPAIPFVSLALALALSRLEWLLLVLTMGHAVASWPSISRHYCAQYAYRLETVSPKAALRIEPEEKYLSRNFEYNVARMVERVVPPGGRVFTFVQPGESYITRELLLCYQSAFNEVLGDIYLTPLIPDWQPSLMRKFAFPARELRKVRVVQTANAVAQWSVAELRVFEGTRELARDPRWRLTARPNPWDIQMAFDNSPVTRWRSWQSAEAGMYLEIDFGRTSKVDSVVVESSPDSRGTQLRLEGMDAGGTWTVLSDHAVDSDRPIRESLRLMATGELKARGVRYVLSHPKEFGADDFRTYTWMWGMKSLGEHEGVRVFYIE